MRKIKEIEFEIEVSNQDMEFVKIRKKIVYD